MRMMRGIAVLILIGAALAAGLGYAATKWGREALTRPGAALSAEHVEATGGLFHLGLRATGLVDERGATRLSLSGAELSAPLWNPLDLSLRPEGTLTAADPDGAWAAALNAAEAELGLALAYRPDLPLARARLSLSGPRLLLTPADEAPEAFSANDLDLRMTRTEGSRYDTDARIDALSLPPGSAESLAPGAGLSDRIDSLSFGGTLGFAEPLRPLDQEAPPRLTRIGIKALTLDWGGRDLTASGTLEIAPDGLPEGSLDLKTRDWESWLDLAARAGWLGRAEPLLRGLAKAFAAQSPDGSVSLPLVFSKGMMMLGPVPLGPAPRLR